MNKQPSSQSIISTDSEPKPDSEITVIDERPTRHSSKEQHNASSKDQLISLAKQFNIDAEVNTTNSVSTLEERARKRERVNHLRQQQNLERIIQKSVELCAIDEVCDKTDQDWFNSYLTLAADISNKTMQNLWANILAKEVSLPGSFSFKTLETFRSLSIHDAKLLAKISSFVVKDKNSKGIRILSGCYQLPSLLNFFTKNRVKRFNLSHHGINFTDLLLLADKHLLFIQEAESSIQRRGDTLLFNYNGQELSLTATRDNCILNFYKFTPVGAEILSLISDNPNTAFLQDLQTQLQGHFSSN